MRTLILAIEFFALLTDLIQLGESPHVVYKDGSYERIALTDSTQMEVYNGADTILVVLTACAPQCSSCARVYNKEYYEQQYREQVARRPIKPNASSDKTAEEK